MVLLAADAWGEETVMRAVGNILYAPTFESPQTWALSITDDGQLEINGKSIERMSDPELKAIMLEIRDALAKQNEDNELLWHYNRQTGYLLEELEKCKEGRICNLQDCLDRLKETLVDGQAVAKKDGRLLWIYYNKDSKDWY
jgi:hypothetical protein